MTPLKYKLIDKHGTMIARFRHDYDVALVASKYDAGAKIRNEQLGNSGRIVCTVTEDIVGDYDEIYKAVIKGEQKAWRSMA